jgi:hypothetical protein
MGDVLHSPVEVYEPDWNTVFDAFPDEARKSRKWALNFAVENGATIFTSHFPAPSFGKILREGSGFRWAQPEQRRVLCLDGRLLPLHHTRAGPGGILLSTPNKVRIWSTRDYLLLSQ